MIRHICFQNATLDRILGFVLDIYILSSKIEVPVFLSSLVYLSINRV